ncbi:MAG: hypothetical protein SNJ84_05525 [Verrucomicrobiia bacterium]
MRVTLKVLAQQLQLTEAAVSMAMRNHPRIGLETRRKVQDLAKQLGYVRNPALARQGALAKPRGDVGMPLALIVQRHPFSGPGISEYDAMMAKVAQRFGYKLQIHRTHETPQPRLGQILFNRGVEAVILGPIFDPDFNDQFPWDKFSVVAAGAGHYRPPCHIVLPDRAGALIEAVTRCVQRGYRNIGVVEYPEPVQPVDHRERLGGDLICRHSLTRNGAQYHHLNSDPYDPKKFLAWFDRHRPDVLICQTETPIWWCRQFRAEQAANLGFVVLQLDPSRTETGFSGFMENYFLIASWAIKLLDAEIRNFERGKPEIPTRQLLDMPWIEGQTLPPRS